MITSYPCSFDRPVFDEKTGAVRRSPAPARCEIGLISPREMSSGKQSPAAVELRFWTDEGQYVVLVTAPAAHQAAADICRILASLLPDDVKTETVGAAEVEVEGGEDTDPPPPAAKAALA